MLSHQRDDSPFRRNSADRLVDLGPDVFWALLDSGIGQVALPHDIARLENVVTRKFAMTLEGYSSQPSNVASPREHNPASLRAFSGTYF